MSSNPSRSSRFVFSRPKVRVFVLQPPIRNVFRSVACYDRPMKAEADRNSSMSNPGRISRFDRGAWLALAVEQRTLGIDLMEQAKDRIGYGRRSSSQVAHWSWSNAWKSSTFNVISVRALVQATAATIPSAKGGVLPTAASRARSLACQSAAFW